MNPSLDGEETFVYLMRSDATGSIKIGKSWNPEQRIKTIRRYVPDVVLIDKVKTHPIWERELHRRFSHVRVYGEWFRLTPEHLIQAQALFQRKKLFNSGSSLSVTNLVHG